MANLKDFCKRTGIRIEKTTTKGFEDDLRLAHEDEDEEIEFDPERGRHLQNIYTAIKGSLEKNNFRDKSKKPPIIRIFNKAAGRLNEHERQNLVEVDDVLFVMAQFEKYGTRTYPGHLLSESAFEIYYKEMNRQCYQVATPSKDSDRKLLKFLSLVRGESEEEVMANLKNAGIFSSAFIKRWRPSGKRRM